MLRGLLLLSALASTLPAFAVGADFSGRIGAGVAVVNRADNLSGKGKSRIETLSEKPHSTTNVYPVPLLELSCRMGRNELYFGSSADEVAGISLGLRHRDGVGVVEIAGSYSFLSSEWEDPYQVGIDREDTNVDRFGMRVAWERIMGSAWGASYRSVSRDLDRDRRGELNPELRRNGTIHLLKAHWKPQLGRCFSAGPFIAYERGAMDGRAESYDAYSGGLDGTYRRGDILIGARVSGGWGEYDDLNPLFGETRREQEYAFTGTGTISNLFGCKNCFGSAGFSHRTRSANIDFFDADYTLFFATIGYSF